MQFEFETDFHGHKFDAEHLKQLITHGEIVGEISHPVKQHGESEDSYIRRLLVVDHERTCCAVTQAEVMPSGALKVTLVPAGPRADVFHQLLAMGQPPEFGYRAILMNGSVQPITFDLINAPA